MKHKITINLAKDTPPETVAELAGILKPQGKKSKQINNNGLYILNEDIEELNARYDELFKQVKSSQNLSETQIARECEILSLKYNFEIELLSKYREVDYEIKLAEIKARAAELKPIRHKRSLRFLFRSLTNRAQDIIEERAELNAELHHDELERQLDNDWKKLQPEKSATDVKLSKRERKRLIKRLLNEAIKKAEQAITSEAFEEPPTPPQTVQPETPATDVTPATAQENATEPAKQLPGQITLDDVQPQVVPPTQARRPRPPRSCRKP